jgi:hypothetical protein
MTTARMSMMGLAGRWGMAVLPMWWRARRFWPRVAESSWEEVAKAARQWGL